MGDWPIEPIGSRLRCGTVALHTRTRSCVGLCFGKHWGCDGAFGIPIRPTNRSHSHGGGVGIDLHPALCLPLVFTCHKSWCSYWCSVRVGWFFLCCICVSCARLGRKLIADYLRDDDIGSSNYKPFMSLFTTTNCSSRLEGLVGSRYRQ